MIPKMIHYCWFGGQPLPTLAKKCIASWQKYLPDYQIKEWNESNFDVHMIPYTREAYDAKKYAFVSDYARFWILYKYGGVYFDTDVEVIRPMEKVIAQGPFMACELDGTTSNEMLSVAPGLGLGVNPGLGLYKELLDMYATLHFIQEDRSLNLKTVVQYTTDLLLTHGLHAPVLKPQWVADVWIYPKEYFCPLFGRYIRFTKNTYTIHHYMSSWKKYGFRKRCIMKLHQLIIFYEKTKIALFGLWNRSAKPTTGIRYED